MGWCAQVLGRHLWHSKCYFWKITLSPASELVNSIWLTQLAVKPDGPHWYYWSLSTSKQDCCMQLPVGWVLSYANYWTVFKKGWEREIISAKTMLRVFLQWGWWSSCTQQHCLGLFHLLFVIALSNNPITAQHSPQILLPAFCPHPNDLFWVSIQTSGSDCRVICSLWFLHKNVSLPKKCWECFKSISPLWSKITLSTEILTEDGGEMVENFRGHFGSCVIGDW